MDKLKSFSSGPALISNTERPHSQSAPDGTRSNHGCSIAAFKPLREKLAVIKYSGWKHTHINIAGENITDMFADDAL